MTRRLSALALTVALLLPSVASARIWPDDFLPPTQNPIDDMMTEPTTMPEESGVVTPPMMEEDVPAMPSVLPQGRVTRIEFVAAIVSRSVMQNVLDKCFEELGVGEFSLLFRDVNVSHRHAKELCVAMQRGLVRGYSDGTFRPDADMNTAEASVMLARMNGMVTFDTLKKGEAWYAPIVRRVRMSVEGLPADGRATLQSSDLIDVLCSLTNGLETINDAQEALCE